MGLEYEAQDTLARLTDQKNEAIKLTLFISIRYRVCLFSIVPDQ